MEEYVKDVLGGLDSNENTLELHGIIRKLAEHLLDKERSSKKLQEVITTIVQGCDASANSLQRLASTALATLQLGSDRAQGQQPTSGKYDGWTPAVFRVSGRHLSLYSSAPEGNIQIWVLKLTAPKTAAPASINTAAADEAAVVYVFVPEDALYLLGVFS